MRALRLQKETLTELTAGELTDVVGAGPTKPQCISGIVACITNYDCLPTYDACFTTHGCAE